MSTKNNITLTKTLINNASSNSQKFFMSSNSSPIETVHAGDVYQLNDKNLPFNRRIYYEKSTSTEEENKNLSNAKHPQTIMKKQ
jgi:hypothetical protein